MMGATQKSHSCSIAQPPTKTAGPVLRAGFTEVFVTGMLMRWMRVSAKPIARPANPTGARLCVAPRITIRNMKVITTSQTSAEVKPYPPGECSPKPFDAKPPARSKPALPLAMT